MERKPDGYISISRRKNDKVVVMIPPCDLSNGEVFEAELAELAEVLLGKRLQARIYKVKSSDC